MPGWAGWVDPHGLVLQEPRAHLVPGAGVAGQGANRVPGFPALYSPGVPRCAIPPGVLGLCRCGGQG